MRKLKKDEQLVKGNYYFAFGESPLSSYRNFIKKWFIKVIDEEVVGANKRYVIEEVFIGEGIFEMHGINSMNYDNLIKEGIQFNELTEEEVAEWKAKITESMI